MTNDLTVYRPDHRSTADRQGRGQQWPLSRRTSFVSGPRARPRDAVGRRHPLEQAEPRLRRRRLNTTRHSGWRDLASRATPGRAAATSDILVNSVADLPLRR